MTHYTINYADATTQEAADAQAIADIKSYLSPAKFDRLTAEFRALGVASLSVDQLAFYLTLAGISGYPVAAWHRYIFPSTPAPIPSPSPADHLADSFDAWADAQISALPELDEPEGSGIEDGLGVDGEASNESDQNTPKLT